MAETRLREQSEERMSAQLENIVENYEELHMRAYSWMKVNLMTDYRVLLANDATPLSAFRLGQLVSELFSDLQKLAQISDEISDIAVYMPRTDRTISLERYYDGKISEDAQERIALYEGEARNFLRVQDAFRIQSSLNSRSDKEPLYITEITLSDAVLLTHLNEHGMERYAIFDEQGVALCAGEDRARLEAVHAMILQADEPSGQFVREEYLFNYRPLITSGCYLVSCIPLSVLLEPVRSFDYFSIFTLILAAFVSALVCIYLSRTINRPFQRLVGMFHRVEQGDMSVAMEGAEENQHEFALVFERFNDMIGQIQDLMDQRVEQEKALQQAQYRELQAHIAPHFLYNSFNVLRHCILMGDDETAARMTKLLANYFRYLTYKADQQTITLAEEYQHVLDYLEIQKIRFSGNISVEISPLPRQYQSVPVPPFVLQPLVENVFKHGIKDIASGGRIILEIETHGDELHLIVRDNGSGMTQEALEALRNAIERGESLPEHSGLTNIHQRLQMYADGNNRVQVDSRPGESFEARICLKIGEGFHD